MSQVSGTSEPLFGVFFVDANVGTAVGQYTRSVVGDYNTILRTVDGGATWTPQVSGTIGLLWSVSFVDTQVGMAFGETVLRTTDGGETWVVRRRAGGYPIFYGGTLFDVNTATGVGFAGSIRHTVTGGEDP